jgi:hypothetical protein
MDVIFPDDLFFKKCAAKPISRATITNRLRAMSPEKCEEFDLISKGYKRSKSSNADAIIAPANMPVPVLLSAFEKSAYDENRDQRANVLAGEPTCSACPAFSGGITTSQACCRHI